MRIDNAGWPFIAAALIPCALLAVGGWRLAAILFLALAVFLAYFFRDPDRTVPADPTAIVSPADGRVMVAGDGQADIAPPGTWRQVSIFLSPVDVHINRIPISGRVTRIVYERGKFLAAYKPESGSANERNSVFIEHDGEMVICRQVVGVLARRLVCRIRVDDVVTTGQRFGLMKFGSRIDLFLPPHVQLRVSPGDRVRGGETILAHW